MEDYELPIFIERELKEKNLFNDEELPMRTTTMPIALPFNETPHKRRTRDEEFDGED